MHKLLIDSIGADGAQSIAVALRLNAEARKAARLAAELVVPLFPLVDVPVHNIQHCLVPRKILKVFKRRVPDAVVRS